MRSFLLTLACTFVVVAALEYSTPANAGPVATAAVSPSFQQQAPQSPPKDINVDINLNRGGGGVVWYRNPVWIAIGGLALVVLLLIVVILSTRGGGGTTIIRE